MIKASDKTPQAGFAPGSPGKKRVVGILFGLPFLGMGLLFCWMMAIRPVLDVMESQAWSEIPCTIATSEVERVSGSDGPTYRIAITFSYTVDGRDYTGGNYDFSDASSSGYDGKAEVVSQYPVGRDAVCWVDPDDPTRAVLSRDIPTLVYFVFPFTSLFILVGAGIILGSAGLLPKKWAPRSRHQRVSGDNRGETQLAPSTGSIGKLVGATVFALFWNGIVSVFVREVFISFQRGDPEWFLVFFLVPFVAVGLGALGAIGYFALALANPKVRLSLCEGHPALGEPVRLRWRLAGKVHRLDDLAFTLEGRESATYRRGTRSVTDRSLFHREILFQTDRPLDHRDGQIEFSVPAHLMHSFDGGNNKIEWSLRVAGAISRWPDVTDSYPLVVRPLKLRDFPEA